MLAFKIRKVVKHLEDIVREIALEGRWTQLPYSPATIEAAICRRASSGTMAVQVPRRVRNRRIRVRAISIIEIMDNIKCSRNKLPRGAASIYGGGTAVRAANGVRSENRK